MLYNIPAALSALSEDLRETDLLIISVVLSEGPGPVRCAASVTEFWWEGKLTGPLTVERGGETAREQKHVPLHRTLDSS